MASHFNRGDIIYYEDGPRKRYGVVFYTTYCNTHLGERVYCFWGKDLEKVMFVKQNLNSMCENGWMYSCECKVLKDDIKEEDIWE